MIWKWIEYSFYITVIAICQMKDRIFKNVC